MTILTSSPLFSFDLWFSQQIQYFSSPLLDIYFRSISFLGDYTPMMLLLITTLVFLSFTKYKKIGQYLFFSTLAGIATSSILKLLIARPRPTADQVSVLVKMNDYSFPSTHCVSFIIYFGFLYYYITLHKKQKNKIHVSQLFLLILIVSVSFSRIYLGAHWLSDCLAGYFLGFMALILTIKKFKNER